MAKGAPLPAPQLDAQAAGRPSRSWVDDRLCGTAARPQGSKYCFAMRIDEQRALRLAVGRHGLKVGRSRRVPARDGTVADLMRRGCRLQAGSCCLLGGVIATLEHRRNREPTADTMIMVQVVVASMPTATACGLWQENTSLQKVVASRNSGASCSFDARLLSGSQRVARQVGWTSSGPFGAIAGAHTHWPGFSLSASRANSAAELAFAPCACAGATAEAPMMAAAEKELKACMCVPPGAVTRQRERRWRARR